LERFAFQIAEWPASYIVVVSYLMTVAGALLAARTTERNGRLPRVPYFAYQGLIFFSASLASQVALIMPFAMVGGFLILLFAFTLIFVPVIAGYFTSLIAMARSRDAFDHPYGAILAFIPLANLYLLFATNREPVFGRQTQSSYLLNGGLGIAVGLVLAASGIALNRTLPARVERLTTAILSEPDMQGPTLEALLRGKGLTKTMDIMVESMKLPLKLDDGRILIEMERHGTTLMYVYSVVSDDGASVAQWSETLVEGNCTDPDLRLLFEESATIEHVFLSRNDGYEDGRIRVDREICGY